jgi:hypothetical protein
MVLPNELLERVPMPKYGLPRRALQLKQHRAM